MSRNIPDIRYVILITTDEGVETFGNKFGSKPRLVNVPARGLMNYMYMYQWEE